MNYNSVPGLCLDRLGLRAGEELEFVKKFSATLNPEAIEKLSGLISEASYHLERNANDKIVMLDLSLRASEIFREVKIHAKTI